MEIKKINKWDLFSLKGFLQRETINKMKRLPIDWEKIFVNDVTDEGLIYKKHMKFNISKINNPIKKWTKDLNRHFSKEDIQMAHRHMKRCSMSLIIREMQIKTAMRYQLTLVKMAVIKKKKKKICKQ